MNDQHFFSKSLGRLTQAPTQIFLCIVTGTLLLASFGETRAQPPFSTVVLDPGHGGSQPGAVHGQVAEKTVNLSLALAVEHYLHNYGINTAITRERDLTLSLAKRARYASYFQKPIFVSLHYNGAPRTSAHGIETFYYSKESRALAALVQGALVQATRAHDRGVRHRGFHVLRKNVAPVSILVEGGFLSNVKERAKVAHPGYRDVQARAIASGIATFMGRNQPTPPQNPGLLVRNHLAPKNHPFVRLHRTGQAPRPSHLVLAALPGTPHSAAPRSPQRAGTLPNSSHRRFSFPKWPGSAQSQR